MSSNKAVRKELEREYGPDCMFRKANIEKKIEAKKSIKTYKRFIQEQRFTRKKIKKLEEMMTLHHLKHRFEGGKTNAENGAIVNALAHMYIHTLPREQEEFINNELRKYKRKIDSFKECKVVLVDELEIPYEVNPIEFGIEEKKKKRYNRAKEKTEVRKLSEEYVDR